MTRYACCDCRKTFSLEWPQKGLCPDCGEQMRRTGEAFRAPPKRDTAAWEIVGLLLAAGILYWARSKTPRPTKLRDVPGWIKWYKRYKRGPYSFPGKSERLRRRVIDGEL